MKKIRVSFLVPTLEGGGSERVIVTLFNALDRELFEPTLVLLQKKGIYLQNLPEDAKIEVLNVKRMRYAIAAVAISIRKQKPDIVFSTLGHMNLLIALLRPLLPSNTKFIARESSTVSVHNKNESFPMLFDFLFGTVYKRFDKIISQCQYMKDDLVHNYKVPSDKMIVINNPLNFGHIQQNLAEATSIMNEDYFNILFVGRLSVEKRVDLLLEATAILPENFRLYIIGRGELRSKLELQAKQLQIENRVYFLGEQQNPYNYMMKADCLALTSAYEGFPNVVLEAHACGTPVVAFKSPGGIAEIIIEGENGFLVTFGNVAQLADKIMKVKKTAFNDGNIRSIAFNRYEMSKIVKRYEQTFLDLMKTEKQ